MSFFASRSLWAMSTIVLLVGYFVSCTHNDIIVPPSEAANSSASKLVSVKTSSVISIDGVIDPAWDKLPTLETETTVPDPGNNLFSGYIGEKHSITLRSMYDDQYVYFLAEVADNSKSVSVGPWYFNPATSRWAQESTSKSYDVNGVLTREGFGEDKIAFLWNIDQSTPKFITQTCYASCHVFSPYTDFSVTPSVVRSNSAAGNHYTNGANEKIDMWWGHLGKDVLFNQMDDNYQDWAGGAAVTNLTGGNANGRHVDDLVVNGNSATWPFRPTYTSAQPQGSINNRQNLKLDGTGATVTVPLWIVPGVRDSYYIAATDTLTGGPAKKIIGVNSNGQLFFDGGMIDPLSDNDYKRSGDPVTGSLGPKCFPGYIASPLKEGRADITCTAVHTGTKWIIEFKRKLKTPDQLKQDVDFSSLSNFEFGVAVWDKSNNQHGIATNLELQFQKTK